MIIFIETFVPSVSPVLPSQYQNVVQNDTFQQKSDTQRSQSDEKLNSPVFPFTGATKLISGHLQFLE